MLASVERPVAVPSDLHWTTLRYFNAYRFSIACFLFVSSILAPSAYSLLSAERSLFHLAVTSLYLLESTGALVGLHYYRRHFNEQLTVHVLVDVLVLTVLMHVSGGLASGLGPLLLVTLAGAGLVGEGRLVLFYAAMATLSVLCEHGFRLLTTHYELVNFYQAGLLSAGFFAVAISARLLAKRVIANEELARKRGEALRNQTLVSQRIIAEMQDGVLVVDRDGQIRQFNPRAKELLGLNEEEKIDLLSVSPALAQAFHHWCATAGESPVVGRATASGATVRVRFAATESSDRDVLVFVEDTGRLIEQSRQLKLAALGRLTASIAHEIRNPLSAIGHAGELLREENEAPIRDRLLRIVQDNVQRVERIVSDVLELGRRDRVHGELLNLRSLFPGLIDDCLHDAGKERDVVSCEYKGDALLFFDKSHFHQVFSNLLHNALRYASGKAGCVQIRVEPSKLFEGVDVHVINDGPQILNEDRERIFEPFFTTHARGTGLGLYITRELCEGNGARIALLDTGSGVDFCVTGRGRGDNEPE